MMTAEEARKHQPTIAIMGAGNQVAQLLKEEIHSTVM
jgi:aspartate 1-decarboxylase